MVNHNAYTNYMAQFTFDYTLNCLKAMKEECGDEYFNIKEKLSLTEDETLLWKEMSDKMYLPYDEETKLFEQHDGFFRLPHINIHDIPVEDFPLYNHWSYDRIYRNDMIKQPDVLMFLFLLNSNFSEEQIRANYEYYEPRCIHESSLSPSVHSILASQIKRHEEAYHLFEFATRLDLDNYNRNTNEGLHIPSIAAAWMNIIYGFGGMRSDRDRLSFSPSVPKAWDGYSFRIVYRGEVLLAEVEKTQVSFRVTSGAQMNILVYDSPVSVGKETVTIAIPEEWRG